MSIPRRAARRDANEPQVVQALERCGFTVERLSQRGVPDLLVSRRGQFHCVEVKLPAGPRGGLSDRELTPEQQAFKDRHRAPVVVLRSGLEAVQWSRNVP